MHYPGAVDDPATGALISDAQVAETPYTLHLGRHRTLTVRLVVRRVKDARYPDMIELDVRRQCHGADGTSGSVPS